MFVGLVVGVDSESNGVDRFGAFDRCRNSLVGINLRIERVIGDGGNLGELVFGSARVVGLDAVRENEIRGGSFHKTFGDVVGWILRRNYWL